MLSIRTILISISYICISLTVFSQTIDTARYRKDGLGSQKNRKKETVIDGNNISTLAYNNGELGQWPYSPSFKWPNDSTGLNYIDGLSLLIGAEATTNKGKTVHLIETYYRERMDIPSTYPGVPAAITEEPLGFTPVGGYTNPDSKQFARSDDQSTWPLAWPSALGLPESQNGKWINRLFPYSKQANLETFYVMDDSKDFEFTYPYPISRGRYYPIKKDEPPLGSTLSQELNSYYNINIRKGLGLRVEGGTYQWNSSKLKNTLFVINDIYNLSDYTYDKFAIGLYLDTGLGGSNDNGDDNAGVDLEKNIITFFDHDGIGGPNYQTKIGIGAIVLLETPGNASNGIDDDNDGLIDEKNDNGIDDDGDWDLNFNDIGKDVTANSNDEGEGDGIPTVGEPNFDISDPDEIDMKGLTSIKVRDIFSSELYPENDENIWSILNSNSIDLQVQNSNIIVVAGTNGFSLPVQSKIRFSYAVIFGKDSTDLYQNVKWASEAYSAGFTAGTVGVGVKENQTLPDNIKLNQNYPNPFNPLTTISITLSGSQKVSLKVYDLLGREIQTLQSGILNSGVHKFSFNGSQLTSGVYFVKLVSGNYSETKKMVLMK